MVERVDPLEKAREGLQEEAMKQRVKNVIRSYRSAADVLAEPIQNAMDELERAQKEGIDDADELVVKINAEKNIIEIKDKGRGMSSEDLQEWIGPDFTDKRELFRQGNVRGHKGVGMTFLVYGFNFFSVESKTDSEHYHLRLEDGRDWIEDDEQLLPPEAELERDISGDLEKHGTIVRIKTDNQSQPSSLPNTFNNYDMTAALIERQTAIGVVTPPERYEASIDAKLEYTDSAGNVTTGELATEYRYPHKQIPDDWETFDLGEYIESLTEEENVEPKTKDKDRYRAVYRHFEPDKIKDYIGDSEGEELKNKEQLEKYIDDHDIHAYVLFSYSVNYREKLEENWNIPGNRHLHYPGARVATDGMISSWRRDISLTRASGNKDRTWIVYNFKNVEPDLGRKNFPQEVHDIISTTQQNFVRQMVKNGRTFLRPARNKTGSPEPEDEDHPVLKAHKRRESPLSVSHVPDVGDIHYSSKPEKEQDVIALFNQLVGMEFLHAYRPVYFDENFVYDSFFDYSFDLVHDSIQESLPGSDEMVDDELIVEFKYEARTILNDVVNNTKDWTEMDLLVCWEIGREDWASGGDNIEFTEPSSPAEREYAGVTHIATIGSKGDEAVFVIAIEKLLNKISV
jgi:hypothetical protein